MMATAFLGYKHSPKWLNRYLHYTATNNSNDNNNNSNNDNNSKENELRISNFLKDKNLKPVYIYSNLNNKSTKEEIKSNTQNLAGVYLILNLSTNDFYVGSASTNRFFIRFSNHLINLTGSKIVKLAVRKYGIENFCFMVLEVFPEKITVENNKKLLDIEDFYLKSLLPNYNILTEAGSSFGYKHTELDRIYMKSNYSQERRDKIGNLNKGKKLSKATIEKMKEAFKTRKKPILSEQAILNMKKKSKPIILYNRDNRTVFGEYSSIVETALAVNCSIKTVSRALKSESKILLRRWVVAYK